MASCSDSPREVGGGTPYSLHYFCVSLPYALAKRVGSVAYSVFYFLTTPERELMWNPIVTRLWGEPVSTELRGRGAGSRPSRQSSQSSSADEPKNEVKGDPKPPPKADDLSKPPALPATHQQFTAPDDATLRAMPLKQLVELQVQLEVGYKRIYADYQRAQKVFDARANALNNSVPLSQSITFSAPKEEDESRSSFLGNEKDQESTTDVDTDAEVFFDIEPDSEADPTLGNSDFFHVENPEAQRRLAASSSALKLWKDALPGKDLMCTLARNGGSVEMSFAKLLLEDVLKVETAKCDFDISTGDFTLTYENPPSLSITQLPQSVWNKIWGMQGGSVLYYTVVPTILQCSTITAAATIKGRIYNTPSGRTIEFGPSALVCLGSSIKSITVLETPVQGKTLFASLQLMSPIDNILRAQEYAKHEEIAQMIDLNLHPELYTS